MNLQTAISLYGRGTSEGAYKAWDTRGRGRALNPKESTEERFRDPETKVWDHKRSLMHDRIVNEMVAGKTPPVDRGPIAYVLGGGTASGKTTMSRKILGDDPNVLRVDPDELKLKIPEYEKLKQEDPEHAPMRVHEESSYLTKSVMAEGISRGLDLTYDATTSGKGAAAMINTLINHGYDVRVMFADVPLDVARERAAAREKEGSDPINRGRHVPDDVIVDSHHRAADNFFKLKQMLEINSVHLFDNSGPHNSQPRPVYSRLDGNPETIHDEERYKQYKKKATGV